MTWTCGKCPAKVCDARGNPFFVVGECAVLVTGQRADDEECPYSLAEMEAMQARYLRMWGYPCDYLAEAITARQTWEQELDTYWNAAVGKPVSTICKPYTSQRGVFAAEITAAKCITPATKCDQPSDNPICPTCANHDGECVCVTECNLGSRYERRGM